MVCFRKIRYIYCSFVILFDNVQSISYLFASRQTYGYVTPHEPALRVDSIIECSLHCIRREKCTSVCYNIYGNRCNVNILYRVSQSSQNSGWICYLFEGRYIMCQYIIATAFIYFLGPGWLNELDYLTTHPSLSPIRRGFAPGFVNYTKGLAVVSVKAYQLLAHGRWFSAGTPASSITTVGRHDIAEILLKVAIKHQKSNQIIYLFFYHRIMKRMLKLWWSTYPFILIKRTSHRKAIKEHQWWNS